MAPRHAKRTTRLGNAQIGQPALYVLDNQAATENPNKRSRKRNNTVATVLTHRGSGRQLPDQSTARPFSRLASPDSSSLTAGVIARLVCVIVAGGIGSPG